MSINNKTKTVQLNENVSFFHKFVIHPLPTQNKCCKLCEIQCKGFCCYKLSFFLFTLCYIALCLPLFIFFQVWISIDANKRVWRAIEYRSRGIPILHSSLNKSVKIFLVNLYQYIFPIVYQSCFLCIWWHLFINFFFLYCLLIKFYICDTVYP